MKKNIEKFTESLDLEVPDAEEQQIYSRRVACYSVPALKAAITIDNIYIQHGDFKKAVMAMDRVFQLAPEMEIAQGIVFTGPTGVGKTAAFNYFCRTLPTSSLFAAGDGAIGLRCPKRPRVGHFVTGFLRRYRYPFAAGTAQQLYIRRGLVFDAIKQRGTRLVFIDEAAGLLNPKKVATHNDGDTEVSEFFREMVDECRVGLVLAGPQELEAIGTVDSALASRLSVREELKPFKLDPEWTGIIRAFASACKTFDLGSLSVGEIPTQLFFATDGNLRSLKRLIIEAVLIAWDANKLSIDREILSKAFVLVFGNASQRSNVFA